MRPINPDKPAKFSRNFAWTRKRQEAALLMADAALTRKQIEAKLRIPQRTLADWCLHPQFKQRVEELRDEIREELRSIHIAVLENRLKHLQHRHDLMMQIIAERAADQNMAHVPGGRTGLMVRDVKSVRPGDDAEMVELYEVDAALLRELRETEKQAAQELGQWEEKQSVRSVGHAVNTLPDWAISARVILRAPVPQSRDD